MCYKSNPAKKDYSVPGRVEKGHYDDPNEKILSQKLLQNIPKCTSALQSGKKSNVSAYFVLRSQDINS